MIENSVSTRLQQNSIDTRRPTTNYEDGRKMLFSQGEQRFRSLISNGASPRLKPNELKLNLESVPDYR